jgi:iron complex outermembrane receptor protein
MRKLLFAAVAFVLFAGCCNKGEQMLAALEEQGIGMQIYNQGETSSYSAPGVEDLLYLTANEPERLEGAVVADKRVGKAAASLLIIGKVKTVYTPLVSTPARQMLEQAGIRIHAKEEIPLMVNREGTGLCPMESKLLNAKTAEECVTILRGGQAIGRQMLDMLNEQGLSLLVYSHGTLTTHDNRGVQDLVQLISDHPERLEGAIVADKVIGKAAAALMATGGVKEVHTNVICKAGKELLEGNGILVFATEEVPQILNRDRTTQCPIDSRLNGVESIEECVEILRTMPARP